MKEQSNIKNMIDLLKVVNQELKESLVNKSFEEQHKYLNSIKQHIIEMDREIQKMQKIISTGNE